jgi:hypothetical protein
MAVEFRFLTRNKKINQVLRDQFYFSLAKGQIRQLSRDFVLHLKTGPISSVYSGHCRPSGKYPGA